MQKFCQKSHNEVLYAHKEELGKTVYIRFYMTKKGNY